MKKILTALAISLILNSCKKDESTSPEKITTYTPTHTQYILDVEYRIKTNVPYAATYTKFAGFNSDGSPILLSVTDSLNGNDTIRFQSITSPFGLKYHYQIFTLAQTADSNTVTINIKDAAEVVVAGSSRPNYGSVFNFAYVDY